jgi:hypothetical protein
VEYLKGKLIICTNPQTQNIRQLFFYKIEILKTMWSQ